MLCSFCLDGTRHRGRIVSAPTRLMTPRRARVSQKFWQIDLSSFNRDVECPSVGMIFAHGFSERSAMAAHLQLPRKKAPNPTDQHIGARVRMRRKMLAMSQTQLADALGITYQQVQKNETGINRIAASRLQQISHILQVPVGFLLRGRAKCSSAARLPRKHVIDCPD